MPIGHLGSGWEKTPDEPKSFRRPKGWGPLDEEDHLPEPTQSSPAESSPAQSRPAAADDAHDLDGRALSKVRTGTNGERPTPEPEQDEPTPVPPDREPAPKRRGTKAIRRPKAVRPRRAAAQDERTMVRSFRRTLGWLAIGVFGTLYVVVRILVHSAENNPTPRPLPSLPGMSARPYPPSPMPSSAMPGPYPGATQAEPTWQVLSKDLRPDLPESRMLDPDNSFDDDRQFIRTQRGWGVMVGVQFGRVDGKRPDGQVSLHMLQAATGEELWRRDLRSGLCAVDLLGDQVVCAAATRLDPATGLGTRWQLMTLRPDDGTVVAQSEVDGWFTQLAIHQGRLVVLEQRQPAPHAVVRAFGADLAPLWTVDLQAEPEQARLFSDNRAIVRTDLMVPDGLALDRIRLRELGDDLLAVHGLAAAFIDLKAGRLVSLKHCTRPIDDGVRIWCNDLGRAQAHDHRLKPLHHTERGVRLAFQSRDPRDAGPMVPLFLNDDDQVVRVDLATGRTLGTILDTGGTETFAGHLPPSAQTSGTVTLVVDGSGIVAIDTRTQKPLWATTAIRHLDGVHRRAGDLVIDEGSYLTRVDPKDGRGLSRRRHVGAGIYDEAINQEATVWASWGLTEVARIDMPA